MKKNRVVFIGFFHGYGGAEKTMIITANQLIKNGFDVELIAINNKNILYEIDNNIFIHYIEDRAKWLPIKVIFRLKQLYSILKKIKPDIVISFWIQPIYLSLILKPFLRTKLIYSERGDPTDKEYSGILGLLRDISFKYIDGIVFQTKTVQKIFSKKVIKKSVVIYNPIVLKTENLLYNGVREKKIINIGRLHHQKNQKLLIEAFGLISFKFPEYVLEIYGDGDLKEDLIYLVNKLQLKDKVFIKAPTSQIHSKICNASLFVLSSDYEGMPNALLEAMALGVPCISVDWKPGAVNEFMIHNYNGIIVPNNNKIELSKAIQYILNNPEKAKLLGENAKSIINDLSLDNYTKSWLKFLNRYLSHVKKPLLID